MPFETRRQPAKRIAVIGAGISGMGAAHLLSKNHSVVLFEEEGRLGGHARTVVAGRNGDQPVDTGFIVFNYATYPNLTKLFAELGVPVAKSDMGFGVSIDGGRMEYALRNLDSLIARRRNAVTPAFWRMVRDILRFNKKAEDLAADPKMTIGQLLQALGTGPWFRDYYILPFSGAIWSTPTQDILDFPAQALVRFFKNHGLLDPIMGTTSGTLSMAARFSTSVALPRRLSVAASISGCPAGRSRQFGARERVQRSARKGPNGTASTRLSSPPIPIRHCRCCPTQLASSGRPFRPSATNPTKPCCTPTTTVMPQRRSAWASWVYTEEKGAPRDRIGVSYWMNSLQPIPMTDPMFVTLNPSRPIRDELIYDQVTFAHPVYDVAALAAQSTVRAINGSQNRTWFCGAWMKNGFHEDGHRQRRRCGRGHGGPARRGVGGRRMTLAVEHIDGETFHGRKGRGRERLSLFDRLCAA
jgi:predicted NAD/FAD-binding protein